MTTQLIHVPASLLLHPDLSTTAKLLWMVAQIQPDAGVTRLAQRSGLSRPTIYTGIAQLAAQGWDPKANQAPGPTAATRTHVSPLPPATIPMPTALLTEPGLEPITRVVYGILLTTPGFHHNSGRFTYEQLATLAHASRNTVAHATAQLVRAEWLILHRDSRRAPTYFELTFPGLSRCLAALAAAQERLAGADPYGEALMREYLSLLIDSDHYEDNAEPGFLLRPTTEKLLQFDRYYPPHVAFEFNGAQHYRQTKKYSAAQSAAQRERDYIKLGICAEHAIRLIIVLPQDLSRKTMQQKVGSLLPLRDLTGYDLLIDYLEAESRSYIKKMARI